MPALILGGVCRFSVRQTMLNVQISNIIDVKIDNESLTQSRAESCENQAGRILKKWDEHVKAYQLNDVTCREVSWVDLDTANGSVGQRQTADGVQWPVQGLHPGAAGPTFLSARINKLTNAGRGLKAGRLFLAGIHESMTAPGDPNRIDQDTLNGLAIAFEAFRTGIKATAGAGGQGYNSRWVVVHRPLVGQPSFSDVTGVATHENVTHQIRRKAA
jgi:hypothetical protein